MRASPREPPSRPRLRPWALAVAMFGTILGIAVAGVHEEREEVIRARIDMVREQGVLTKVLAAEFRAGLAPLDGDPAPPTAVRVEGRRWLLRAPGTGARVLEPWALFAGWRSAKREDHRLLLAMDEAPGLRDLEGRPVALAKVEAAIAAAFGFVPLDRAEARSLGLAEELAFASFERVETRSLGRWTLVVVRSAQHLRGRETRRARRLLGGGGLVGLVVLGFGVVAFRTQRQELVLAQALAREELRARQEEQLAREGRAATMLTFAAGMAHEVSTPLGVIGMRAEQLVGQAAGERERRAALAIEEQVGRIRELMRRFLRIARGAAPLRERFAAGEVLAEAATRVRHRFDRAGVRLRVGPTAAGAWVRGDARLLEHALANLLVNACDAAARGTTVDLQATADAGELTIRVLDRGAGIDPAQAARVLEPFVSTKADDEGAGVGLAIANEVVRMHRGALSLEAREGGGTCAVIRLPAEAEA